MFSKLTQSVKNSRHVKVSGFRNPRIFCLCIPESEKIFFVKSGILGFGIWNIQLKESRIPLTIEMQNPSSTDKYWNPESKTVLDSLTLGDRTLLTLFVRPGSNAVLHISLT